MCIVALGNVSGAVSFDCGQGRIFELTMTGNCTFAEPSGLPDGEQFFIKMTSSGSGYTISWDADYSWVTGPAPKPQDSPGPPTYVGIMRFGSKFIEMFRQGA